MARNRFHGVRKSSGRRSGLTRLLTVLAVGMGLVAIFAFSPEGWAQDIRISTPRTGINDSFFERNGVSWGFQLGGPSSQIFGSFNQGSFGSAIPPFGGYDPNSDATFGFNQLNDNGSGYSLAFRMGKGSTRTMTSASPSVVVPNGGIGSIFDGSFRPFVTGLIPVVGEPGDTIEPYVPPYQAPPEMNKQWSDVLSRGTESPPRTYASSSSGSYRNENSSAQHGDLSVADITQQRAEKLNQQAAEIAALIAAAEDFEKAGEFARARNSYRKAIKLADGRQRYDLQVKLEALQDR